MIELRRSYASCRLHRSVSAIWLGFALFSGFAQAQLVPAAVNKSAVVRMSGESQLEVGQAWLLRSGEECLAIMPWHVIQESKRPSLLVEGGRILAEAADWTDLGDDVGVSRVIGINARDCGMQLGAVSRNVDETLARSPQVNIRTVLGDGTVSANPASVIDDDGAMYLRLTPVSNRMPIRKGQSGSLIMVGDRVVGQLLSVGARDGVGKAIRLDALLARVSRHRLSTSPGAIAIDSSAVESAWSVVAWNSESIDATYSASSLTSETGAGWKTVPKSWPIAVELLAANSDIQQVESVTVQSPPADPRGHRVLRYQVLASTTEAGNDWRSVAVGEIELGREGQIQLGQVRARRLRLEFFPSRDYGGVENAPVTIQRVHVR